ncbi:21903_t:CDS:2 [Gigaspora margarita]|uniref:21903_t:CDS:1 n=1 Tax=Gigaspora margarita TaxID=4874 RepID=A0ABN7UJ24_GIGMA|nr:21903_t:CDS:2 [Gigaspora margarita]
MPQFFIKLFLCFKSSSKVPETGKEDSLRYYEWIEENLGSGVIQILDHFEFNEINEIGRGGHGVVYSAEYRGEKIVYKELKNNTIRTIVNELKQHVAVNNSENVIKFLGITIGKNLFSS